MAGTQRMSIYSTTSSAYGGPRNNSASQPPAQVSSTTLLNSIHTIYTSAQSHKLDASTSLVVNTWLTTSQPNSDGKIGGTVDAELSCRAWEHARRRAEDGCIILGSLHESSPSLLTPLLETLPLSIPPSLYTALSILRPFLCAVSPQNPCTQRQKALGVTLTMALAGNLTGAKIALSDGGIDTSKGLINLSSQPGNRVFDVFYYMLTSASTPAEREFLGLKPANEYAFLSKSNTYDPPSYLPTADDTAAADDFRNSLKAIGIKGSTHRSLISILAGLLKLGDTLTLTIDEDVLEEVCEDVGGLLGLEPEVLTKNCTTSERETLISGLYEALVDWIISKANETIADEIMRSRDGDSSDVGTLARTPNSEEDDGDSVCLTVLEIPDLPLGKAVAMRGVFDDTQGINFEMKDDGIDMITASSTILREMQTAIADIAPDLGIMTGSSGREREHERDRCEAILEKIGREVEDNGFLKRIIYPVEGQGVFPKGHGRLDIGNLLGSSRVWYHLNIHPTDELPSSFASIPSMTSTWSASAVSRQIRAWRLPEWANRRNRSLDFTADFDIEEFVQRYAFLGCKDGRDGVESWIMERGWSNGEVVIGKERIWMRENAWWEAESMLDMKPVDSQDFLNRGGLIGPDGLEMGHVNGSHPNAGSGYFPYLDIPGLSHQGSRDNLLQRNQSQATIPITARTARSVAPTTRNASTGDYGLGTKGDTGRRGNIYYSDQLGNFVNDTDAEMADPKNLTTESITTTRRIWIAIVWTFTFWIPSIFLRIFGRMKRPDVQMAWREKFVLCWFIVLLNGLIVFWIIFLAAFYAPTLIGHGMKKN